MAPAPEQQRWLNRFSAKKLLGLAVVLIGLAGLAAWIGVEFGGASRRQPPSSPATTTTPASFSGGAIGTQAVAEQAGNSGSEPIPVASDISSVYPSAGSSASSSASSPPLVASTSSVAAPQVRHGVGEQTRLRG